MNQEKLDAVRDARARGEILRLLRTRHKAQSSRMDHVELWYMLRALGLDLGENDVITFLQDLGSAELVEFDEEKDRQTNRTNISKLQLCTKGLRVLEGRATEDIVLL